MLALFWCLRGKRLETSKSLFSLHEVIHIFSVGNSENSNPLYNLTWQKWAEQKPKDINPVCKFTVWAAVDPSGLWCNSQFKSCELLIKGKLFRTQRLHLGGLSPAFLAWCYIFWDDIWHLCTFTLIRWIISSFKRDCAFLHNLFLIQKHRDTFFISLCWSTTTYDSFYEVMHFKVRHSCFQLFLLNFRHKQNKRNKFYHTLFYTHLPLPPLHTSAPQVAESQLLKGDQIQFV